MKARLGTFSLLQCALGAAAMTFALAAVIGLPTTASAQTQFTGAVGGMAFGVTSTGAPVSPGVPTYALNNVNGRSDILTNPGLGQTANPVVANNTLSVGPVAWGPGQFIFGIQNGGGNINGPFGSGAAIITGPRFGYRLADGGVPGGFDASYEIMSWDANFTQGALGAPVGTTGTYVAMGGFLPNVGDAAVVSLRTQLIGPALGGAVELPGLILAVDRTGPATYAFLNLQDNVNGGAGATAMPGGWATIIDNAATGKFRALAFNVLPDLGALDGFSIPAGAAFTARVTATVYSDPASFDFIDPIAVDNLDLLGLAQTQGGGTPFPTNPLAGETPNVPEPSTLSLLLLGAVAFLRRRR
jgi:PEP-CTERM motif